MRQHHDHLRGPRRSNAPGLPDRDLRPVKLQQKISGTWRTLQGLADFAAVRSYLSTAAKHGQDALDVLQQLFTTGPWMPTALSS